MEWKDHTLSERWGKMLHLSCKIRATHMIVRHVFTASVIETGRDQFTLYMPEKSAGAPLLLKRKTRKQINVFLEQMKFPKLPE